MQDSSRFNLNDLISQSEPLALGFDKRRFWGADRSPQAPAPAMPARGIQWNSNNNSKDDPWLTGIFACIPILLIVGIPNGMWVMISAILETLKHCEFQGERRMNISLARTTYCPFLCTVSCIHMSTRMMPQQGLPIGIHMVCSSSAFWEGTTHIYMHSCFILYRAYIGTQRASWRGSSGTVLRWCPVWPAVVGNPPTVSCGF